MSLSLLESAAVLLMASSCEDYSKAVSANCNTSGFYCYLRDYDNVSIGYGDYFNKRVSCYNVTASKLCPAGFYCPNATELVTCPIGSFCGQGSVRHYPCMFGAATCPYSRLTAPLGGVLFILLFFILLIALCLLSYFAAWKVSHTNQVKHKSKSKTSAVEQVQHDQELVFTSLGLSSAEEGKSLTRTASVWDALERNINSARSYKQFSPRDDLVDDSHSNLEYSVDEAYSVGSLTPRLKSARSERSFTPRSTARSVMFADEVEEDSTIANIAQDMHAFSSPRSLASSASMYSPRSNLSRTSTFGKQPSKLVMNLLTKQPTEAEIAKLRGAKRLAAIIRSKKFKRYAEALRRHRELNGDDNQFVYKDDHAFKLRKIENPVHVSFDNLRLVLKKNRKIVLLHDVFGTIHPFQITALMGPSGSGKTTLLNMLRGVAHYAKAEGVIYVNRVPTTSLAAYRDEMAFVPQDDILYEELTVEENISFSAILFNRRGYQTREQVEPMVRHALLATGLASENEESKGVHLLRHSIVGGSSRKGISGGQKKRVSIAMEMMKEAAMFFLDEPTTGLDSATSMAIIGTLIRLRNTGVNIVATLHQPRYEIFNQIQSLILLAPGGRLAYFGNPHLLRSHMKSIGYLCHPEDNMADFIMDLIAGFVPRYGKESVSPSDITDQLVKKWYDDNHANYQKYLETEEDFIQQWNRSNEDHESELIHNYFLRSSLEKHRKPSLKRRLQIFFYGARKTFITSWLRQEKVNERSVSTTIYNSILLMLFGALVALLFGPISLSAKNTGGVAAQIVSSQLTFALLTLTNQIRIFSTDYLVRLREENGGLLLLPWFLGKVFAGYIDAIFTPISFVFGYYSFVQSRASFLEYWLLYVLLYAALCGLANFCACMFVGKNRVSISSAILVIFWCFGGVSPSYSFIKDRLSVLGILLNACSPFKWSLEMQGLMEFRTYSQAFQPSIESTYRNLGYSTSDLPLCISALILYAIISNALALLMLILASDNYKVKTE